MDARSFVALLLALSLPACGRQGTHRAALDADGTSPARGASAPPTRGSDRTDAAAILDGRERIPAAREMEALFPATCSTLSYSGGVVATARWFGVVVLHGRYRLVLVVPVKLDADLTKIVWQGEPEMLLEEYGRHVQDSADASPVFEVVRSARFGAEDWSEIVRSGGDLETVLGHPMRTDPLVPPFEEELYGCRADR